MSWSVSAGLTTVEPDTVQVCGFTDICVEFLLNTTNNNDEELWDYDPFIDFYD